MGVGGGVGVFAGGLRFRSLASRMARSRVLGRGGDGRERSEKSAALPGGGVLGAGRSFRRAPMKVSEQPCFEPRRQLLVGEGKTRKTYRCVACIQSHL